MTLSLEITKMLTILPMEVHDHVHSQGLVVVVVDGATAECQSSKQSPEGESASPRRSGGGAAIHRAAGMGLNTFSVHLSVVSPKVS